MKLLVIGHSVIDSINNIIKPGGIYYSVTGLINYADKHDEISLLTSVSGDTFSHFESLYSKVSEQYFKEVSSIPTVFLKLYKDNEREEHYSNLTEKLDINDEYDFMKFDGILINMITGFDISLDDLKLIRSKFGGLIYFDVHTFSRGLDKNNKRYFRKIPDTKEWISNVDIIQANDSEIFTLSDKSNINDIIIELFDSGIKILIITKGSKGASIFYKNNSMIESLTEDALKVNSINSVGCGDIFGAVFFYSYIASGNISASLKRANAAAGISTTYKSFNEYLRLREDADRLIN